MPAPSTRQEFKDSCLRRLGFPVIQINVDDDQVDDRIDDALQFFHDYHFEGCEKVYMKHRFTQEDIDRRWIYCPDPVLFVIGVLPLMTPILLLTCLTCVINYACMIYMTSHRYRMCHMKLPCNTFVP